MSQEQQHQHQHRGSDENLKIAFFLNLGFTLLEIAGGFWTNSIAILTDAVHDLGDSVSLGLAWYFEKLSLRKRTPRHTYGYRRFRLLGGLITGLMLLAGLGFVLFHAFGRLNDPQEVRVPGMLVLAILGIAFNGAAVLRMKGGSSLTEKLVSWHLIEDTLGWFAVLVGAGIMMIWNVPIVDPILSIGISLIVLWNVGRNLKKVFSVLLQTAPEGFNTDQFECRALGIDGVDSIHHIHCWSIDGESHVLSAHLVLTPGVKDIAAIKEQVRDLVDPNQFEHVTLETEGPDDDCPQSD
ncbi:MAG: cation transporter [Verrucomicrobiae bacterium]|nr:cation transporter [Verrucomicrobiae bacterium]MCB1232672.1 cation transporter [Verrucomicrobiae bacterium]